jgi:hypothetical protein
MQLVAVLVHSQPIKVGGAHCSMQTTFQCLAVDGRGRLFMEALAPSKSGAGTTSRHGD